MHGERGAEDDAQVGVFYKIDVVEEFARELFAEEDNLGLHQAVTYRVDAARDCLVLDVREHLLFGVGLLAVDACLAAR